MSTIELRHVITNYLSQIEDVPFLNAIKTIIESKVSEGTYKLSDYQLNRINIARDQLKEKKVISHEDLQNEIDQWLGSK